MAGVDLNDGSHRVGEQAILSPLQNERPDEACTFVK